MAEPLIELDGVWRGFGERDRLVSVVEDLNLAIAPGEALCLVGESGCGKTTTGRLIAGLLWATRGRVRYRGRDIRTLTGADWREYRLGVQLVHQDPFASLNPTQRVGDILAAPLRRHLSGADERARRRRLLELLDIVDLAQSEDLLAKYPHQLSGGQRQRVAIARALTVDPSFIVADEAISMVDVSIRVSILDTLRRLQRDMGLGVLLITHDLALARYFSGVGRIGVMYLGRLVEIGPASRIVAAPTHPYTAALVAAVPADPRLTMDGARAPIPIRSADVPSVTARPPGCPFHPRCPLAEPGLCDVLAPALLPLPGGVDTACHLIHRRAGAEPPAFAGTTPVPPP